MTARLRAPPPPATLGVDDAQQHLAFAVTVQSSTNVSLFVLIIVHVTCMQCTRVARCESGVQEVGYIKGMLESASSRPVQEQTPGLYLCVVAIVNFKSCQRDVWHI